MDNDDGSRRCKYIKRNSKPPNPALDPDPFNLNRFRFHPLSEDASSGLRAGARNSLHEEAHNVGIDDDTRNDNQNS